MYHQAFSGWLLLCASSEDVKLSSKTECNNISMKSKSLSNLARNRICTTNTLQPDSMVQIHPQSTNTEELPAESSSKATQSVRPQLLLPKTAPCLPKRELQFSNNPDSTHNVSSTQITKSMAPADTDHVSIGVWSRPPPTLMSQSMTKEPAQHTKSPQLLLRAMFA